MPGRLRFEPAVGMQEQQHVAGRRLRAGVELPASTTFRGHNGGSGRACEVAGSIDSLTGNLRVRREDPCCLRRAVPVPFGDERALHNQLAGLPGNDRAACLVNQLEELAASPEKARAYYQPLIDAQIANWAKNIEPIANESK